MLRRSLVIATLLTAGLSGCIESEEWFHPDEPEADAAEGLTASSPTAAIAAVTASAHDGNVPANVLDGSLATRWSCLGIGCWIQADLGATKPVGGVGIAWYAGAARVNAFVVSVSTDGTSWTQVFSGKSSGTTTALEAYAFPATSARYVRVTVNGNTVNTWASITELRAFSAEVAPTPTPTPAPGVDAFGTKVLYPTVTGGRTWAARWSSSPRVLRAGQVDPLDPEFTMRGSGHTLEIKGDGTARSFGDIIRFYVGDPSKVKKWKNVELTLYGKRVSELAGATSASGFEFETSTDAGHTSSTGLNSAGLPIACDGAAYAFSYRNDGRGLFQKELKHPYYTSQVAKNVWGGAAFPKNVWVGMKIVVRTVNAGRHVRLELWRDRSDGAGGGTWEKVLEHTDAGGWSIDPAQAASCKIAADHIITAARPYVILRNDKVGEQWLKKVTLREIAPLP